MYDYVIIGAGFFGATCAYELNKKGYKVCVIDRRNHIGGNCYTEDKDNIPVLMYGPQVFHTPNKSTWDWINQFSEFNHFKLSPVSLNDGKFYPFPFNMWTFYQVYGGAYPDHINNDILSRISIENPLNLEDRLIKNAGNQAYEIIIKGFIKKYWGENASELSVDLVNQYPTKLTYNTQYYENEFEGMPVDGYTPIFNKLLEGIDVRLNTDIFRSNLPPHTKLIYSGPIDRYFNYKYGKLKYRSFTYRHKPLGTPNHQGNALVYFNGEHIPYTRIVESKHFFNRNSYNTWIAWEYPVNNYTEETNLMYPTEDLKSKELYKYYEQETHTLQNVIFGGKLATYKNLSIAETIESALKLTYNL